MTTNIPAGPPPRLSVPPRFVAPRQLTDAEVGTLRAIADVLIPASGNNPAATSEPAFDQWLARASTPAAPSTRQTPPARTDTAMRWTKVLNVVECHAGAWRCRS